MSQDALVFMHLKQWPAENLANQIEKLMNIETAQIQVMQLITMHKQLLAGNSEDPVQAILAILTA